MTSYNLTLPRHQGKTHSLKVWPAFFEPLWTGAKAFEIRRDDRGFAVGDVVDLHEFDPILNVYLDRQIRRRITYITDFLQKEGFVVMQLAP